MTVAIPEPARPVAMLDKSTDSWVAVLNDVVKLANNIAATEFVPQALRGSVPKVVAAIMHGRELGLPPMTALAQTFVINGKPGNYAEMQRALILAAGHQFRIVESTVSRCVMKCRRADWPADEWATFSFTMQEAATAGYARNNQNYTKAPAEMLLARCTGRMAKGTFPDVIHGLATVEELSDLGPEGEFVASPVPQTTATVSRQSANPPALAVESGAAAPGGAAPMAMGAPEPVGEGASEQRPAPSSTRKRPPLTPRGKASQPEPKPEVEPVPDEDGVVEAEVVEDAPEPSNVSPLAGARADIRRKNIQAIVMHFNRLLGEDTTREERLWWTRILVANQDINSTNDLTADEIRTAMQKLDKMRDRDQLEATVSGQADE